MKEKPLSLEREALDFIHKLQYEVPGLYSQKELLDCVEAVKGLAVTTRELKALTEHIPGGIHQCRYDEHFTIISVTNGFLSLTGYTREELRRKFHDCYAALILEEDLVEARQMIQDQLTRGDTIEIEYRICRRDGTTPWILDKGKLVMTQDGKPTFYCMMLDITVQHMAKEELRLSLERHEIIMNQATDIIFDWDIRSDTLTFSKNWHQKFGYDPISRDISRQIPFSQNIHPEDMPAFIKIMEDTSGGRPYTETEFRIRDLMGNYTWCRIRTTTQYDAEGVPLKAVGVIVDIDADKKQHLRLLEQAQRDSLTGLLNKSTSRHAVESILKKADSHGVLLIIDLDNFKQINDRYGHLCGDTVLSDIASALKRMFRATDVVARIGGDEFLICLPGAPAKEAERKARAVIQTLSDIVVYGRKGHVSGSVGAAVFPDDADYFTELYRCADLALYTIKNTKKGGFAFYRPELSLLEPDGSIIRTAVNASIDSETDVVNERLGQYCFRMLYRSAEPVTAVKQILEIVGRTYDVSRAYICEFSENGQNFFNAFEWCGDSTPVGMENFQELCRPGDFVKFREYFDKEGVFYCKDVQSLAPRLRSILEERGVRSLLQCSIMDEGEFWGFVGFDECRESRHWTRPQIQTLSLVANVLSVFLLKIRYKEKYSALDSILNKGGYCCQEPKDKQE